MDFLLSLNCNAAGTLGWNKCKKVEKERKIERERQKESSSVRYASLGAMKKKK